MDLDLPSRCAAVGDRPGGRDRRGADGGRVHMAEGGESGPAQKKNAPTAATVETDAKENLLTSL